MHVAYGPPGESGVKQLMHVGHDGLSDAGDDRARAAQLATTATFVGLALWGYGEYANKKELHSIGRAVTGLAVIARIAFAPRQ